MRGRTIGSAVFVVALAARTVLAAPPTGSELDFLQRLASAAARRTEPPTPQVTYDPTYFALVYPGGDVPADRGVCTDVVIRSLRQLGVDLQKDVHEDMAADFAAYPTQYKLKRPDRNIDHRRVPNLRVFFARHGVELPISRRKDDYLPGEIVTWNLPSGQGHIGIVADRKTFFGRVPLVVHNVGAGDVVEDVLFEWELTGHYRYFGKVSKPPDPH